MSIILSKKLEDEVLKDNFPSSFSIEPKLSPFYFLYLYVNKRKQSIDTIS